MQKVWIRLLGNPIPKMVPGAGGTAAFDGLVVEAEKRGNGESMRYVVAGGTLLNLMQRERPRPYDWLMSQAPQLQAMRAKGEEFKFSSDFADEISPAGKTKKSRRRAGDRATL